MFERGSTLNKNTDIGKSNVFTVSVSLMLESKYFQFQIIGLLLCSIIVYAFKDDPVQFKMKNGLVKPNNTVSSFPVLFLT